MTGNNALMQRIRAKKLGAVLRALRQSNGAGVGELAAHLGIEASVYEKFETGESSPSLPELEAIAARLSVPVEQLWSTEALAVSSTDSSKVSKKIRLRQRLVGALLRKAREEQGLSLAEAATRANVSENELAAYELGETPAPFPVLESLARSLGVEVQSFVEPRREAKPQPAEAAPSPLVHLPEDLQSFVSKPINKPYLEMAQRLSEMDVQKLRTLAEGLLEITL